jgi:predicted nucleotidyltransferase
MKTETYKQYRETWDRRLKKEEQELERKRGLLFKKVRLCAEKLKELGGRQVILFGSLAIGTFRKDSDVDIAVDGLSVDAYFKALGILEEILEDVTFDLVDIQEALPSVLRKIEREGIEL